MEFYVARALQVRCLEEYQLEELHKTEKQLHYPLSNFNIQQYFILPTIKEWFAIPEDLAAFAAFSRLAKTKIKEHGLDKSEFRGFIDGTDIDAVHSFDWGIMRNKDLLDLTYQDTSKRGRKLKEMVCLAMAIGAAG